MTLTNQKRLDSPQKFFGYLDDAFSHMSDIRSAHRSGRVSKAFSERIMLAVTQVNGCRYCSYYHSKLALEAGMSPDEIAQMMDGDLSHAPASEMVALAFAQHYAESKARPDASALARLEATYGPEMARDILAYIRMITIGNVYGDTFDSFQQRLHGRPTPQSSLTREFSILVGSLAVVPVILARQGIRRVLGRSGRGQSPIHTS